jgi:membrane-bound lytic murein transglycosylase A
MMQKTVLHLGLASLVVLIAGCSTVSVPPEAGAPGAVKPEAPLTVPSVGAIPDSAARQLQGKFVAATWSELPGWNNDDLRNVWTTFVRNCRGLMRPTSTNLAGPTRATPRAWQPVCAAALDPARAPAANDTQAVRRFIQTWLSPWRLQAPDGKTASNIVTGYYEPGHILIEADGLCNSFDHLLLDFLWALMMSSVERALDRA